MIILPKNSSLNNNNNSSGTKISNEMSSLSSNVNLPIYLL